MAKLRAMGRPGVRAAVLLGTLLAMRGAADAADAPPPRVVEYAKDALTVRLTNVPVDDVLDEVGRQAGAEIRGGVRSPHQVSVEFEQVPLPEALHRLLGEQNFTLVYGEGGRLRAVKLLGGPQTRSAAVAPPPPPAAEPGVNKAAAAADTLMAMLAAHSPVPITGRLMQAFKSENVSVQQLVEASLRNDDPSVRSDAVRRTIGVLEAEPDLRLVVMNTLKGMDDGDLARLLQAASSGHAEEVITNVATQSHASELRIKASGVLQKLRAQSHGS